MDTDAPPARELDRDARELWLVEHRYLDAEDLNREAWLRETPGFAHVWQEHRARKVAQAERRVALREMTNAERDALTEWVSERAGGWTTVDDEAFAAWAEHSAGMQWAADVNPEPDYTAIGRDLQDYLAEVWSVTQERPLPPVSEIRILDDGTMLEYNAAAAEWRNVSTGAVVEPEPEPADLSILNVVDLGSVMRDGVAEIELLVPGRLARGTSNVYFGPAENGKTWIAVLDAAYVIALGGIVIWVDKEMGRAALVTRLLALGLQPADVSARLVYLEHPTLDCSRESVAAWQELLAAREPELIVVDAFSGVLVDGGLAENSAGDVKTWLGSYFGPALQLGITTLLLDHTGHDSQDRTRGSSAKGQDAKLTFQVELVLPFDRDTVGLVRLTRRKNTLAADVPEVQTFELGGDGRGGFRFEPVETPDARPKTDDELYRERIEGLKSRLVERLADVHPEELTGSQLRQLVTGRAKDVGRALAELAETGLYVTARPGLRGALLYTYTGANRAS